MLNFKLSRIGIAWEDGKVLFLEGLAGETHIQETGVDFGSVRAALGTGECFIALVPRFSVLTSFLVVAGGLNAACRFTHTREAGAETTRLEGFAPIRELPFRGSLLRTVLLGCSQALARSLERGKGREMVSVDAVSKPDLRGMRPSVMSLRAGRSSRETLRGLVLSLRGAEGGSSFVELGLALERAD